MGKPLLVPDFKRVIVKTRHLIDYDLTRSLKVILSIAKIVAKMST